MTVFSSEKMAPTRAYTIGKFAQSSHEFKLDAGNKYKELLANSDRWQKKIFHQAKFQC